MRNVLVLTLALASAGCGQLDGAMHDLARAPEAVECGWVRGETQQLDELPAGKCWRVVPAPSLATTAAGEAGPCDVTSEPRTYAGGAFVDRWGRTFDEVNGGFQSEIVDCVTGEPGQK